jgi:hypothetical protein
MSGAAAAPWRRQCRSNWAFSNAPRPILWRSLAFFLASRHLSAAMSCPNWPGPKRIRPTHPHGSGDDEVRWCRKSKEIRRQMARCTFCGHMRVGMSAKKWFRADFGSPETRTWATATGHVGPPWPNWAENNP